MLDDANSAGSHLPNRGRQHTLQVKKRSPAQVTAAGQVVQAAGQRHGQGKRVALRSKLPATVYSIQHTQRARGPPLPNLEIC